MHKDTIVGIAGAAILVAAMAGVFWYEGTRGADSAGARQFDVTFTGVDSNGPGKTGSANVGTDVAETIKLAGGNLTKLTFTLVWTDDANTQPDSFKFKVEPPAATGLAAKESDVVANGATGGEIKLDFTLGALPSSTSLLADTPEQAEQRAMQSAARSAGAGDWKITITLVEAGDATPVALPGGLPVNPADDASNGWELKTILTQFAADAS